jgi:hypothetical protein
MSGGDRKEQAGPGVNAVLRVYSRLPGEEPPRDVDAAVLAAGRDAARPVRARPRRWWIPVSVAATALLALSVVLDVGRQDRRDDTRAIDGGTRIEDLPRGRMNEASSPEPAAEMPAPASPPPEPAAAGRLMDGPEASSLREAVPMPAQRGAEQRSMEAPRAMSPYSAADAVPAREPAYPSPEAWLARIEALEQAGREDEAARERAALEAAYPGWLDRRQSTPQ